MPLPLAPLAGAVGADISLRLGNVAVKKLKQMLSTGQSISSLADLARPARVEPLVLVEQGLADQPYMTDIMRNCLTTFSGYYMQAMAVVMNVGRIETLRTLDALNPNRSVGTLGSTVADVVWSKESYAQGLPSLETFQQRIEKNLIVEVQPSTVSVEADEDDKDAKKVVDVRSSASVDDETVKKFYEVENLSVGKLLNVELRDGENKAKLPVLVRLMPSQISSKVLTHIFTATGKNNSWSERWHLWRAGQISFVRDLMFSTDLIDEHRKVLINDTSNVYMTINDRRRNNVKKSLMTGAPSMADASNIAIISKQTAKDIGRALYGKIEQVSVRKKIFDSTYLILLYVVDEQWERVTVYHRGIDQPTELSFRDIKSSEKGKGPDITEILKAYQLGASPSVI